MSKIADNKDIKNLLEKTRQMHDFLFICEKLGEDFDGRGTEIYERGKEIYESAERHTELPDKFNGKFAEYGWFATEELCVDLMEQALAIFQKDGIEQAEKYICSKFDDDYFKFRSHRMKAILVWKDTRRGEFLELAYTDHKHGRYHASVPVVLAQIDGLCLDTNKELFYGNKSALVIDNSIAAHETGLLSHAKKASKPRKKTTDSPIHFPYRHGIMHGRDLAYDNELVSTKCFFLLFALRPWALQCEFDVVDGDRYKEIPGFTPGELLMERITERKRKFSDNTSNATGTSGLPE